MYEAVYMCLCSLVCYSASGQGTSTVFTAFNSFLLSLHMTQHMSKGIWKMNEYKFRHYGLESVMRSWSSVLLPGVFPTVLAPSKQEIDFCWFCVFLMTLLALEMLGTSLAPS